MESAEKGRITVRVITDREPWFDGKPLHEGELVKMTPEEARPFIEKRFAMEVEGA